ncbi:hypothetical protein T459_23550 [Capsicum annuum]|uniref:Protein kinase domain-containing protein n=1 Tax=Capsicum annuum TaxID=4072 RepID=A0A2G2YSX3_CAPAN|nr:hypothetical protein FXO37_23246 [Capsicum annuum]PHT72765.1 hypothetical protein T459_23550 [Capsicum annuum]
MIADKFGVEGTVIEEGMEGYKCMELLDEGNDLGAEVDSIIYKLKGMDCLFENGWFASWKKVQKGCLVVSLSNCSSDWWCPFGFFLVKKDLMIKKFLKEFFIESRVKKPVLNWARRYKIALGYARGLAYLHCLETPVTHGNVMSKNVLVDEFIVSRLTEFGLDKIMIPAVADDIISVVKAEGYKVPELQRMKKCNSRTDVYAFDILLLEIVLGKKPGKNGRNGDNVDLPALVKVAVLEETTLEVFDMELLKGIMNPMEEGLVQSLRLAMGCCAPFATVRRRWMK